MLHFWWRDPDAGLTEFTDLVDLDRLPALTGVAEQMGFGSCTLIVDDPEGTLDFSGLRQVFVNEDAATFQRIWTGYTAAVNVTRDTYRAGSGARIWELELTDINSVATRRIFTDTGANRPAETDIERIQWLASTSQFAIVDDTTTWVSTAAPVDMDAADYRGQYCFDVINDCAQQSGKNAYILDVYDSPNYILAIWYGSAALTTYTSSIRISNVLSDIDGITTFAASLDTQLARDPSRVYSGIYLPFDGGAAYRTRATTATAFAARDTVSTAVNVKTLAKANARADRMLVDIRTPEDVITTTIIVPPSQVNDVRPGMLIDGKFSHLPGYEGFVPMRVLNRTVTLIGVDTYQIALTLSPHEANTPAATCAAQIGGSIQASAYEGGERYHADDPSPITFGTAIPDVTEPSVFIILWGAVNQTEPMCGAPLSESVSGGYTGWFDSRAGYGGTTYPSLALAGYKHVASGAAGTMTVNFATASSSAARSWRPIGMSFATAATTPVQTGQNVSGSSGLITLAAPPTAGNLLVGAVYAENDAGVVPAPGWTLVVSGTVDDGVANGSVTLLVRCAVAGETNLVDVSFASHSSWCAVSEWALT